MAVKKGNPSPAAGSPSTVKPEQLVHKTPSSGPEPKSASKSPAASTSKSTSTSSNASVRNTQDAQQIVIGVWNNYVDKTPQRVKLLDAFMTFLMVVGVLQFVYCVIAGNYVSIRTR